jgi:hypothetical protein
LPRSAVVLIIIVFCLVFVLFVVVFVVVFCLVVLVVLLLLVWRWHGSGRCGLHTTVTAVRRWSFEVAQRVQH